MQPPPSRSNITGRAVAYSQNWLYVFFSGFVESFLTVLATLPSLFLNS
jgi:hypothetical protein